MVAGRGVTGGDLSPTGGWAVVEGLDCLGIALDPTSGQLAGASAGTSAGRGNAVSRALQLPPATALPPSEGPGHVPDVHPNTRGQPPAPCVALQKRSDSFLPFFLF